MMTDQEKIDALDAKVEAWCNNNRDIDKESIFENPEFIALIDEVMELDENLLLVLLGKAMSECNSTTASNILNDII